MSHDNVEIIRRMWDATFAGAEVLRAHELDRYISEFFDPEIEWHTASEDPDAGTHRGAEAFKRYLERWIESFDGLRADVEECVDAGDDSVFVWSRWTGRGRTSGADADWHLAIIYTMRDGLVVRGDEYFDRGEALEVAGLPRE